MMDQNNSKTFENNETVHAAVLTSITKAINLLCLCGDTTAFASCLPKCKVGVGSPV